MATAVQVNTFGIERRSRVLSGKPNGSVERCMHVHLVVWDSVANEVQQLHVDAMDVRTKNRLQMLLPSRMAKGHQRLARHPDFLCKTEIEIAQQNLTPVNDVFQTDRPFMGQRSKMVASNVVGGIDMGRKK